MHEFIKHNSSHKTEERNSRIIDNKVENYRLGLRLREWATNEEKYLDFAIKNLKPCNISC